VRKRLPQEWPVSAPARLRLRMPRLLALVALAGAGSPIGPTVTSRQAAAALLRRASSASYRNRHKTPKTQYATGSQSLAC